MDSLAALVEVLETSDLVINVQPAKKRLPGSNDPNPFTESLIMSRPNNDKLDYYSKRIKIF